MINILIMFLSHISEIKKETSFITLPQYNNKKIVVNNNGYWIVSNVCPHQRSLISIEAGIGNRTCPLHSWAFSPSGAARSSGRTEDYCKNTAQLESTKAFKWKDMLFSVPVDFDIGLDFSSVSLVERRIDRVKANYVSIMDLFLDVDHIPSVHQGVYDQVGLSDISVNWQYRDYGSAQIVNTGDRAAWIAIYPYTMIEWQNGFLFITVAKPDLDTRLTDVHIFKYKTLMDDSVNWKLNETVWETAWAQDKEQATRIVEQSDNNLEPQKLHFREFLKTHAIT